MNNQKNEKQHEFSLWDEILGTTAALIVFGMLFGFLCNIAMVLMGNPSDKTLWIIICMIMFGAFGIGYAFKLRKIDKEFGIRQDNIYSIDKVKDYFGAPINIIEDKDNSYYTFHEEILGMFAKTHTFTTNKSGKVIRHEVSFITTNKKD